ncbi:thioredoxin [Rhizobium halophytocola]|uniref:Thioredoxin n=1 Tax=Rhizobium halophytocola TaxID=735519 RepID=A0ABS4E201_9HYPH|nr:thioredoxin [Rhizobium halophytocola]MBP1851938.1 putative thioredoxin [Rhizobium halophytocola]
MSDTSNPYGSFGSQMTATAQYGAAPSGTVGGGAQSLVSDTTTAGFSKDVLDESRKQPVLVDFWAPWCGPCKQLTPVIEKVVNEAAGRVKLVKLNIDDHPSIPGQLGIQSIPAVIAFVDGRPVDGFMGAVPESQVREFIDKLAGADGDAEAQAAEIEAVLAQAAELLAHGSLQEAAQLYGAVLQADQTNAAAYAGMAECMIAANQHARASELIANAPPELAGDAALQSVAKKLELYEEARKLGDPVALEQTLAENPDDHEARMKLAKILNVQGNRGEAADHLLSIMKRDRTFDDDGARRQLLEFFEAWGPKDPATIAARRRLSSILFS